MEQASLSPHSWQPGTSRLYVRHRLHEGVQQMLLAVAVLTECKAVRVDPHAGFCLCALPRS